MTRKLVLKQLPSKEKACYRDPCNIHNTATVTHEKKWFLTQQDAIYTYMTSQDDPGRLCRLDSSTYNSCSLISKAQNNLKDLVCGIFYGKETDVFV